MIEVFQGALHRVVSFDTDTFGVFWLSLKIGVVATTSSMVFSLPLAWFIHNTGSWPRAALSLILQALLAVPTVIVGTVVYLFLSRNGPLGALEMLYNPSAIIIGDILLVVPLTTIFILTAFVQVPKGLLETARNLGASSWQTFWLVVRECRGALLAATCTGFGRVISEVGCAMILGGNIKGMTRTLTTTIALEMGKGETEESLALGILLLALAIGNALILFFVQRNPQRGKISLPDQAEDLTPAQDMAGETITEPGLANIAVPPIKIKGLCKSNEEKIIFEDLTIDIDLSGGMAISGPSGGGKTTLLRLICGLIFPDRGCIKTDDREAILIFQRPHLFTGTVIENITLGLRLRGISSAEAEEKTEPLAQALGLQDLLTRTCENLSGGEIARVSLGRALALKPPILLLDETLVHIDRASLITINKVLRNFIAAGNGFLMVTHNEEHARLLCRHHLRLVDGKFTQVKDRQS